ncbi:MAG TPA: SH3 domain-containing protein [Chitinophagales bacterium]|nr:SH3 domain-containing protein [Chitinophagales bacterium]
MKTTIAIIAAALILSFSGFTQIVNDQSFRDLSFVRFRNKLTEAILDRDTSKLFPLLAEQVHLSDEGCSYAPKTCFMEQFREGGPDRDKLWDDMLKAVSFGFSHNVVKDAIYRLAGKGEVIFQAPSYLKSFDDKNSQLLLVLGQNVNIREKPSPASKVVAQASFESLKYVDPLLTGQRSDFYFTDGKQWYQVILRDGRTGFIMEDFTSASLKRELSVKKVNGEWKIISFYSPVPKC